MSLRSGSQIAKAGELIINPNNLKIEGWYCQDRLARGTLILQGQDIRDIIAQGIVVNDRDALAQPEDLIRLQEIMKHKFLLIGKPVVTSSGKKLGKVTDFATDTQSLFIQKIYVARPLLKSLSGGSLGIDRTQIVEITNRKIVVNDLTAPTKEKVSVKEAVAVTAPLNPA